MFQPILRAGNDWENLSLVREIHFYQEGAIFPNLDRFAREGDALYLDCGAGSRTYTEAIAGGAGDTVGSGETVAPMSGKVLAVHVAPGDAVTEGDPLVTMEAMKLETKLLAEVDGTVAEIRVNEGDQVQGGDVLVSLQQSEEEGA